MAKQPRRAVVTRQVLSGGGALRRLLCIVAVAALTLTLAQSTNANASAPHTTLTWRPEGTLSDARYALAAATARNGAIFVIGGAGETGVSGTVEVYLPKAKRWLAGPSLPVPRYRLAAATGGDGRIYALGGSAPGGEGPFLGSVLRLKPGQTDWQSVAPMPTARQLLAAATGRDGRIYALGGHNYSLSPQTDGVLNVLEIYDTARNQWTTGAPMPTPRAGLGEAAGADGRIYAIGGCGAGVYNALNVVEAYSPKSGRWQTLAPLPSRRCSVNATTGTDGRIYVIGGCEVVTDDAGNPIDCVDSKRVDAYSPRTKTWQTVTSTNVLHSEGAVVTSGNRIFAIGGHTDMVESARVLLSP